MKFAILCLSLITVTAICAAEHRFVCVDNGENRLIYVDQLNEGCDWATKLPGGSRDLQLVEKNVVLVSHGNGAGEYSLKDGKLIRIVADGYKNINSARRLLNGGTMLISRSGKIFVLSKSGKQIKKFKIQYDGLDIRLMRFNASGNMLVAQTKKPRCLLETDMAGRVICKTSLPDKGYRAHEMNNGNVLVSIGDSVKVIEIDAEGKIVRFAGGREKHEDAGLDFFSGFDVLANGNIIVANWLGHGKQGTAPHLFEFDGKNDIVWSWDDHKKAKQVTNVLVLE